jgi:hypothetical protein
MGFLESCKSLVLYLTALIPLPFSSDYITQQQLAPWPEFAVEAYLLGGPFPKFPAPNGPGSDGDFVCKYPGLGKEWSPWSAPLDRGCWLKKSNGEEFNVFTNYEESWPVGITRGVGILLCLDTGRGLRLST